MTKKLPFGRFLTAVAGVVLIGVGTVGFSNLQGSGGYILKIFTLFPIILGVGLAYAANFPSAAYYRIISRTFAGVAVLFILSGVYSFILGVVEGGELANLFTIVLGVGGIFLGIVFWWLSRAFELERQNESVSES